MLTATIAAGWFLVACITSLTVGGGIRVADRGGALTDVPADLTAGSTSVRDGVTPVL